MPRYRHIVILLFATFTVFHFSARICSSHLVIISKDYHILGKNVLFGTMVTQAAVFPKLHQIPLESTSSPRAWSLTSHRLKTSGFYAPGYRCIMNTWKGITREWPKAEYEILTVDSQKNGILGAIPVSYTVGGVEYPVWLVVPRNKKTRRFMLFTGQRRVRWISLRTPPDQNYEQLNLLN